MAVADRIQGVIASDEIRDSLNATVGELTAEVGAIVPISPERIQKLTEADPDPHPAKFVVVEIRPGQSNNKRSWSPEILQKVAAQVNEREPLGYAGHPFLKKEFDAGADFPDPQTMWLSALYTNDTNGPRLLLKGYNLTPEIRRKLQVGAVNAVSICGDADMVRRNGGGYDVTDFDLKSVDWARKGSEGMQGRVLALTGEQSNGDERSEIVKPEDIAALTEGDLRRHNPSLVSDIEAVGEKRGKDELTTKVGEMEKEAEAAEPTLTAMDKIRSLLKLDEKDDVVAKIGEVMEAARGVIRAQYEAAVDKTLGKIKDDDVRGLVKSLVGEMDEEIQDEDAAAEAGKKAVDELLDTNEHVKKLVGEMDTSEEGESKPRVTSPPSRTVDRSQKKDNENLEYTTQKVA